MFPLWARCISKSMIYILLIDAGVNRQECKVATLIFCTMAMTHLVNQLSCLFFNLLHFLADQWIVMILLQVGEKGEVSIGKRKRNQF